MGYDASGAPKGAGFWEAIGAGAAIGFGAAYVPASWGIYGAILAGEVSGISGDIAGQYIGNKASAAAAHECAPSFGSVWNPSETLVQGVVGMGAGVVGYGGSAAAVWIDANMTVRAMIHRRIFR